MIYKSTVSWKAASIQIENWYWRLMSISYKGSSPLEYIRWWGAFDLIFKIYFSRCDNSNSKYATVSAIPEAAFKRLLSAAHIAFQKANSEIEQAQKLQKNIFDKMLSRLTKGQSIPGGKITIEDTTEQVVKSVSEIVE